MNILLVEEKQDTRGILQLLLEKSRHHLDRKSLESFPEPDLEAYDMVVVDGAIHDCTAQINLVHWIREARRRYPHLPVAVMNNVGPREMAADHEATCDQMHTCGVFQSDNGVLNMRCRLREMALGETAALMRNEFERPLLEPITFEYSGVRRMPNE